MLRIHGCVVVTADPGLAGTGWAVATLARSQVTVLPQKWGVLRQASGRGWVHRAGKITEQFGIVLDTYQPSVVVLEWVGVWPGSLKSTTASFRGDLLKLAALTGMLVRECSVKRGTTNIEVYLPVAQDWKGQLSKDVVERRLKARHGLTGIPNHACDAVGMLMSIQGVL